MAASQVLLTGVPASGKSYFGQWLEQHHGFIHLDVKRDGRLAAMGLLNAWNVCFQGRKALPFAEAIRALGSPVLLNWGFPVRWLSLVQDFKANGFTLWWFDADHEMARREFTKRGDVALSAFEQQIQAISRTRNAIGAVFTPNIITTLDVEGHRARPEKLFAMMFQGAV